MCYKKTICFMEKDVVSTLNYHQLKANETTKQTL